MAARAVSKRRDDDPFDHVDMGAMIAGLDILGRSGARGVEIAHNGDELQEDGSAADLRWTVTGTWEGTKVWSAPAERPGIAVRALLGRVLNGAQCGRCGQTMLVDVEVDGFCCVNLIAGFLRDTESYRYVRTCEL